MPLYEVFVVTTADFKTDDEGTPVAGRRKEFYSATQARKFIPDWLLCQPFNPETGERLVVPKKLPSGEILTAKLELQIQELDEEIATRRGLKKVKNEKERERTVWTKVYKTASGKHAKGAVFFVADEIKPEPKAATPTPSTPPAK